VEWQISDGGNGHLYEAVLIGVNFAWEDAQDVATARGDNWQLATVTTEAENEFVKGLFGNKPEFFHCCSGPQVASGPWLGATSSTNASTDWQWVTGEAFEFSQWGPAEPFGNGNRISYATFAGFLAWNDISSDNALSPQSYILECSGTSDACRNGTCHEETDSCATPACATDPDCDDTLFCNGAETCVEGACNPGTPLCGDDGAFCNGTESCNEDTDQCAHSGDPCAPGGLACQEDADECSPSGPTVFFDNFEGGIGNWFADNGIWEVGVPTSGPNSAHSPENVAATVLAGDYPDGTSSRLVSPSIQLPAINAEEELRLRFWHWFSFAGFWVDSGVVQIREQTVPGQWGTWTSLSTFDGYSGVYTNALVDLSGYAGKKVQVGFLLSQSGGAAAAGWYIDDITIDVF
jgi:hypothetical protein